MLLSGTAIANTIKNKIKQEISAMDSKPCLAIIQVGENPASSVYVKKKKEACKEVGIKCKIVHMPEIVTKQEIKNEIDELNNDSHVNGIIIQLPLPNTISPISLITHISPTTDVDGLNPINAGQLSCARSLKEIKNILLPATPQAVMRLVKETGERVMGKRVCIVGRSNLVGKPLAHLFLLHDATVTICHSKTKHLVDITKQADILVVAAGVPKLITKNHVKKGAVVIDVGINKINKKLVGDVDFDDVKKKADWITPVPGGVGPLTVVYLLKNVVTAYSNITN